MSHSSQQILMIKFVVQTMIFIKVTLHDFKEIDVILFLFGFHFCNS